MIVRGDGWTLDLSGHCPVQAEGFVDGWLVYFRARCEVTFQAWPGLEPCDVDPERGLILTVLRRAGLSLLDPAPFQIDDVELQPWCPDPGDGEESYPGWWSHAYAEQVVRACIERLREHAVGGKS